MTVWYVGAGVFNLFSRAPIIFSSPAPFAVIWNYPTVNVEYDRLLCCQNESPAWSTISDIVTKTACILWERYIDEHGKYATSCSFIVVFSEVKTIIITRKNDECVYYSDQEIQNTFCFLIRKRFLHTGRNAAKYLCQKIKMSTRWLHYNPVVLIDYLYIQVSGDIGCYMQQWQAKPEFLAVFFLWALFRYIVKLHYLSWIFTKLSKPNIYNISVVAWCGSILTDIRSPRITPYHMYMSFSLWKYWLQISVYFTRFKKLSLGFILT